MVWAIEALEVERGELHARIGQQQDHASELLATIGAHERTKGRMQQELDAAGGTLEQAVAAGASTQHELEGAIGEQARLHEEMRMLRLRLKSEGARASQLEAELNKLARDNNHWEARHSRQTQVRDIALRAELRCGSWVVPQSTQQHVTSGLSRPHANVVSCRPPGRVGRDRR